MKRIPIVLTILLITVMLTVPFFTGSLHAFDITLIKQASPKMLECLSEKMGTDTIRNILEGQMPTDKKSQKRLKKVYERCAIKSGNAIPEDIKPYTGPLFDAMSQIKYLSSPTWDFHLLNRSRCL